MSIVAADCCDGGGDDIVAKVLAACRPLMRRLAAGIVRSVRMRFRRHLIEWDDEYQELALRVVRLLSRCNFYDYQHAKSVVLKMLPIWSFWRIFNHFRRLRRMERSSFGKRESLSDLILAAGREVSRVDAVIDAWEILEKSSLSEYEFEILYSWVLNGSSETRRRFRLTRSQFHVIMRRILGIIRDGGIRYEG